MSEFLQGTTLFSKRGLLASFLGACALAAAGLGLMIWTLGGTDEVALPPSATAPTEPQAKLETLLKEEFKGERLEAPWVQWRCVSPKRGRARLVNGGLQLGVATHRAEERGVYLVGARTQTRYPTGSWLRVRAKLDWRPTGNNSYRTAGLLISGAPFDAGLEEQRPAVWVEVVGVPPGRNARLYGALRLAGREQSLFEDGWPQERSGRAIKRETLEIELRGGRLVLRENGREVATKDGIDLGPKVWIALYTTSQANFLERPVVFEEVTVESVAAAGGGSP